MTTSNLTKLAIKSMCVADTEATEAGENKNPIPQMQIRNYDAVKSCGKLGHYGFYGNAPVGSLVMVIQANGQEECLFGAEDDVNNRPRGLSEGEVMMYNTITKNYIYFDKDGNTKVYAKKNMEMSIEGEINITVTGGNVTIHTNKLKLQGDMEINGNLSVKGNTDIQDTLTAGVVEAGNGTDGTFTNSVTVEKGITTSGS